MLKWNCQERKCFNALTGFGCISTAREDKDCRLGELSNSFNALTGFGCISTNPSVLNGYVPIVLMPLRALVVFLLYKERLCYLGTIFVLMPLRALVVFLRGSPWDSYNWTSRVLMPLRALVVFLRREILYTML